MYSRQAIPLGPLGVLINTEGCGLIGQRLREGLWWRVWLLSVVKQEVFKQAVGAHDSDYIFMFAHHNKAPLQYLWMKKSELQDLAQLLKALGEYNRLSLVYQLCGCKTPENARCMFGSIRDLTRPGRAEQ